MQTLLIAGADTVVGANLAVTLADRYDIVGLSTEDCQDGDPTQLKTTVESSGAERIVWCGVPARSSWQANAVQLGEQELHQSGLWRELARLTDAQFTAICSDAVFRGPWMFHTEDSESLCDSPEARYLQRIETVATADKGLVIRTNAFGWSGVGENFVEKMIAQLAAGGRPGDPHRHATPLLATHLAEILHRAWEEDLAGVYHIAGSERISPARFAWQLAQEFDLPLPYGVHSEEQEPKQAGFGTGETSLHTLKIRKALCVAMPTIRESLEQLREQDQNGYRDELQAEAEIARAA